MKLDNDNGGEVEFPCALGDEIPLFSPLGVKPVELAVPLRGKSQAVGGGTPSIHHRDEEAIPLVGGNRRVRHPAHEGEGGRLQCHPKRVDVRIHDIVQPIGHQLLVQVLERGRGHGR